MFNSNDISKTFRFGLLLAGAVVLTGCASFRERVRENIVSSRPAAASVDGRADWAWDIQGDAMVRPLQVFSLSGQTYFQMRPSQRIPAIFVDGTPVPFTIAPPYIIVQGTPARFNLIADGFRAIVTHRGPVTMPNVPVIDSASRVQRVSSSDSAPAPAATIGGFIQQVTPTPTRTVEHPKVDVAKALAQQAEPQATSDRRVWRITPSQKTLSRALADWAKEVGVRLVWRSNVDLPIRRPAEYVTPKFFAAMSGLLADAGACGYQFFYSVKGRTVTVISVKQS